MARVESRAITLHSDMSELPPNDSPGFLPVDEESELPPSMDLQWPHALDMLWNSTLHESSTLHEDEVESDGDFGSSSRLSTPIDDASSTTSSPRFGRHGAATRSDFGNVERAAAARRRKQYRERKKCELVELRGKCATLTAKLEVLLTRNNARKKQYKRLGNKPTNNNGGWEAVAFRQLQRRMAAEALNRDLRAHLRLHHDMADQYGRSWKRQTNFLDRQRPDTIVLSKPQKEMITFDEHDMRLIASLIQDSRGHADTILANCEVVSTSRELYSYEQNWRRDCHQGREFLEFVEKWAVPFGLAVAVPALQRTLPHMLAKECDPAVFQIPGTEFATAIKYIYTCEAENGRTERYHNILVLQVFMESHRATLCWRTVSEQNGFRALSGSQYDEHGWGVAQQLPGEPETAGTKFTFCTHLSSRRPPSNESGREHFEKYARKFAKTMVKTSDEESVEWHDTLENVAMDGLIAMRTGSIAL